MILDTARMCENIGGISEAKILLTLDCSSEYVYGVIAPQNSPRAHFKLHYYGLCVAARLIGNSVRRRKLTISA